MVPDLEVPGRLPCMAVVISRPAEELVGRLLPGRAKPVSGRPLAETGRTTWVGPPPASLGKPSLLQRFSK